MIMLGIAVYSGCAMLNFLYRRGVEKSRLYTANPLFFLKYLEITKAETGKYGIWFKICVISFILTILIAMPATIIRQIYR